MLLVLKEPSRWDGSLEHPQHMFWLRNKKINSSRNPHLTWGLNCHVRHVCHIMELYFMPHATKEVQISLHFTVKTWFRSTCAHYFSEISSLMWNSVIYCPATQEWQWRCVLFTKNRIYHLCINPIRIGLIHKWSILIRASKSGVYNLMFHLTFVNKLLHHCHSWLARQ